MLTDETLAPLNGRFATLCSTMGRPSIPPEHLWRATLPQAFCWVRSERTLTEQIDPNPLSCRFVGLPMDARIWHPTVFPKTRDRVLEAEGARQFPTALRDLPRVGRLVSDARFAVDGTPIDAWAR